MTAAHRTDVLALLAEVSNLQGALGFAREETRIARERANAAEAEVERLRAGLESLIADRQLGTVMDGSPIFGRPPATMVYRMVKRLLAGDAE